MSVDDVYKICQYACNKSQQGYLAPDDFNLVINQASLQYLDYLLGEFQQYTPGRPVSRVEFGNNRTVRQRLTPFIYQPPFQLSINSQGFAPYPGDYQSTDTMLSIYNQRIRFSAQHKFASYYNSVIDPIASNPIYLIETNGFRFYPNTLGRAQLSYIRTPQRIHWGYTNDVNGQPVYDAATSEQPRWYDTDIVEVIARALKIVGVNLQAAQVEQYAKDITREGQ